MNISPEPKLLDYKLLGDAIRDVFTEGDKYRFDKYVPEFKVGGKYLGDFFELVMLELRGAEPPVFYHTYSPYDVISRKTSDYGAVFQAADLLFSGETTPYIGQRTGVMSPLVMRALGVQELKDKNVLFVGTGKVARCALAAFKAYFPDMSRAEFVNAGSDAAEFVALATELGVDVRRGDVESIGAYDVIVCHAAAKEPVLAKDLLGRVKQGAFISTFASEDHMELLEDYYNTAEARVIIDWDQTAREAVELRAALADGLAKESELLRLNDVFGTNGSDDTDKKYTIYRSHGTPMQNLAFLKLLMNG